jgi:hypothetical protein
MSDIVLSLPVQDCPACHGDHARLRFEPAAGPAPGQTHAAICPATGRRFWMDTRAQPGAWEGLLRAAGVRSQESGIRSQGSGVRDQQPDS